MTGSFWGPVDAPTTNVADDEVAALRTRLAAPKLSDAQRLVLELLSRAPRDWFSAEQLATRAKRTDANAQSAITQTCASLVRNGTAHSSARGLAVVYRITDAGMGMFA